MQTYSTKPKGASNNAANVTETIIFPSQDDDNNGDDYNNDSEYNDGDDHTDY